MRKNSKLCFYLIALIAVAILPGAAWAGTIDITLTKTMESGNDGSTVMFDAVLTNTSLSTIFLNASGGTTSSPFLTIDGTPFLLNAPLTLAGGGSTGPINLFDVIIAPGTPAGLYTFNTFTILGGLSPSSFQTVGSTTFSLTVPEPASLWELAAGLSVFVLVLRRRGVTVL